MDNIFKRNSIISASKAGKMCVPVLAQVICRYREKEAAPHIPNSQSTQCMCLRSQRFKSKAEVLLLLVWGKDQNFVTLCEPGEHADNLYILLPISKLLKLLRVGPRAKLLELKAPDDIPRGGVHAWWEA